MDDQQRLPGLEQTTARYGPIDMPATITTTGLGVEETPEEAYLMDYLAGRFLYSFSTYVNARHEEMSLAHLESFLPTGYELVRAVRRGDNRCQLYARTRSFGIHLDLADRGLTIHVMGKSEDDARGLARLIASQVDSTPEQQPDRVEYGLWIRTEYGTEDEVMEPRHWLSQNQNYSAGVQRQLMDLMSVRTIPEHGGRVILFHGEPGTGKTWALRSLMTEWRDWARFEFIFDVDRFFTDVSYCSNILHAKAGHRQRVLVMEDADEHAARRLHRPAGMARLLNMADGILSEHQRVAFLFTTNAAPDELDIALTRPGRCLAAIEFGMLSSDEANAHFADVTYRATRPMTIAEVFMQRGLSRKISHGGEVARVGSYL